MPVQTSAAPVERPAQEREMTPQERYRFISETLQQFGISLNTIEHYMRINYLELGQTATGRQSDEYKFYRAIFYENPMMPLESRRWRYELTDPTDANDVLGLLIFTIGTNPDLRRMLERSVPFNDPLRQGGVVDLWKAVIERDGFSAFAQSDETMMLFLGTILRSYSGSVSGSMSDGTQEWLFGRKEEYNPRTQQVEEVFATDSSRVAQTLLGDMGPRATREWLQDNYRSFMDASVFYAWATTQMGMSEAFVSDLGRRLYGGIWDYATAVGKNLEFEGGNWILHTSDSARGWETSTTNLALRDMRAAKRQLGTPTDLAPAQVAGGALSATPVRSLATEFEGLYGDRIIVSNTSERVFLEGLGWGSSYSGLFAGHDMETVLEAATFYSWATRTREADSAEVERLGRERYGSEWALARVIGEYLEPSRSNRNHFVVKTGRADDLQVALDMYAAGVPAEAPAGAPGAPVVAEAGEFAEIAARYGVSEEFLRRAVELIDRYGTVRVSFNRSDTAEEGVDEGMSRGTPWLRYHPPNGQTSHADTELYAAAREAAELRGITFRTA